MNEMQELGVFLDSVPFSQIIIFILGILSVVTILDKHVPIPLISKYLRDSEEKRLKGHIDSYYESESYRKFKEKLIFEVVEKTLKEYFSNSFQHKEQERIELRQLFRRLNITNGEAEKLRCEIDGILRLPSQTKENQAEIIKGICKIKGVIIDQSHEKARIYKDVNYYLNFVDIMNENLLADQITVILSNKIKDSGVNLEEVFIVVPMDGNYLLGHRVATMLTLPLIIMRSSPRVLSNQFWDGSMEGKKKAIMIHDVGVTSKRLVESSNILTTHSSATVIKIFMIIDRMNSSAEYQLNSVGLDYEAILRISGEDELETIIKNG